MVQVLSRALPRLRTTLALGVVTWLLVGCGARGAVRGGAAHAERVGPATPEVSDDGFAAAVHDLLVSEPRSAERAVRLGAVEARQMSRAEARYRAHSPERGLAALSGGMYLVHVGEAMQGMLGPHGVEALRSAARELSLKGDEGRARAIYGLLLQVAPENERPDIRAHLQALATWTHNAVAQGFEVGPVGSA
jgi:hypothetical protein